MEDPPSIELIVIFALILLNGFFSLSEMAIVSARKSLLRAKADQGNGAYRKALSASENPSRFLSTIQIGITLIGTLSGAFGGATLAGPLAAIIAKSAWLAPYAEALAIGTVVLCITFFSIVIGELVPKQIALSRPEAISASVVPVLGFIALLFRPVVSVLSFSTSLLLKLIRVPEKPDATITEEEIHIALQEGERSGIMAEQERSMMEGVFYLGDRPVEAFMTHRSDLSLIESDTSATELIDTLTSTNAAAHYLLVQGGADNVVGVLHTQKMLAAFARREAPDLRALAAKPVFVPATMPALKAVDLLRKKGTDLLLVIDEYGGVSGALTLRDLVEEIVGELVHSGKNDDEIVRREDGTWLFGGLVNIDEVIDLLDMKDLIPEHREYHTLAGFILDQRGEIPRTGDFFEWENFRFEIVDMDGNRIDKVLIRVPENRENAED